MYSQCKSQIIYVKVGRIRQVLACTQTLIHDTNYATVTRLLHGIERCMGCVTHIGAAWNYTVPITKIFFSLGF